MKANFLCRQQAALLVIDVQEKLFPLTMHAHEVLPALLKLIKGCQILKVPIIATEQYPQGLGSSLAALKHMLGEQQAYFSKTTFSCLSTPEIAEAVVATKRTQWLLAGIEAHICLLQTAKTLHLSGYEVVILNDATSSRALHDYTTALEQARSLGIVVSSVEAVLFELLQNSQQAEFKKISQLLK